MLLFGNPSQKPLADLLQLGHLRVADLVFGKDLFSEHLAASKNRGKLDVVVPGRTRGRSLKLYGRNGAIMASRSLFKRGDRIAARANET